MNRTTLLLSLAGTLAVVALAAGRSAGPAAAPWNPLRTSPGTPTDPVAVRPGSGARPPAAAAVTSQGSVGQGALTLAVQASNSRAPAGDSQLYLRVDVRANHIAQVEAERAPVNLAVALDHSGSMQGGKLDQAKAAAQALIGQLREGDRLSVVAFSSGVRTYPSVAVTSDSRAALRDFVDNIHEGGGTNISTALEVATEQVRAHAARYKVSRVILLSDGQPTEGLTRDDQILAVVDRARGMGITTSAMGVGLDFNGPLMTSVASRGSGTYAFIEDARNLGLAFADELRSAGSTVARKVTLTVAPVPGVEVEDVVGRQWQRAGDEARVSLYDLSPGQSTQLLVRVRVRNAPADGIFGLARVQLDYQDLRQDGPRQEALTLALGGAPGVDDVAATQEPEVLEFARRADVSVQLEQARAAYEAGDTGRALSITGNIRSLFGMSADALAGTSLDEVDQGFQAGGAQGSRTAKDLTMKTMKNFGANNGAAY